MFQIHWLWLWKWGGSPTRASGKKITTTTQNTIFFISTFKKKRKKKIKEETKGFDKQSATKSKYGPYCHALYSQLDGRSLRTNSWLRGKWLWVMGNTAWTCAHERKKKLFKKKKKKKVSKWTGVILHWYWSQRNTTGEIWDSPCFFLMFSGLCFLFYCGCFPLLLFYFFLVVRSFSSVIDIYVFQEKLERLRDTENEALRGNGKHREIGILTLPKFPFRHFHFLSTFFPPSPGFEIKSVFCFSFISSLFLFLFLFFFIQCLSWFCFSLGKCARIVM